MGPGLSLYFILQGQETKDHWDCYLLMSMENYPHANAQRQWRAAPGTAPAHPLTAGLVLAVRWQQHFLLPACVFWMRDPTGLLWPERVPRVLELGPLQTLPYNTSTNLGSGSSSLCSGTCCPWLQPQTHSCGSPQQKPQTFVIT